MAGICMIYLMHRLDGDQLIPGRALVPRSEDKMAFPLPLSHYGPRPLRTVKCIELSVGILWPSKSEAQGLYFEANKTKLGKQGSEEFRIPFLGFARFTDV